MQFQRPKSIASILQSLVTSSKLRTFIPHLSISFHKATLLPLTYALMSIHWSASQVQGKQAHYIPLWFIWDMFGCQPYSYWGQLLILQRTACSHVCSPAFRVWLPYTAAVIVLPFMGCLQAGAHCRVLLLIGKSCTCSLPRAIVWRISLQRIYHFNHVPELTQLEQYCAVQGFMDVPVRHAPITCTK